MKILVFLHGTLIMHSAGMNCTREERVIQVIKNHPSVSKYGSYVLVVNAKQKIRSWEAQGADISYFSSHQDAADVETDRELLNKHGFPAAEIYPNVA